MRAVGVLALAVVCLAGCAAKQSVIRQQGYDFSKIRTAYVVRHADSTRDVDVLIERALMQRGIQATHGPKSGQPQNIDAYITYIDHWTWDMNMYMSKLDITVYDARTDTQVSSATYSNAWHVAAKVQDVVQKVVDDALRNE